MNMLDPQFDRDYIRFHWDRERRDRCPDCRALRFNLCPQHWREYDATQGSASMREMLDFDARMIDRERAVALAERIVRGEA